MSVKSKVAKLEAALVVDQTDGELSAVVRERIEAQLDFIYGDGPIPEPVPIEELTGPSRIIAEKIQVGLEKAYGEEACAKRAALKRPRAKTPAHDVGTAT